MGRIKIPGGSRKIVLEVFCVRCTGGDRRINGKKGGLLGEL